MTQGHGREYEHTLCGQIDEVTPPEVWTTTCGYSGNAGVDACDIVVTVDPKLALQSETIQYNIEAKRRQGESGKRVSNVFAGGKTDETGLEELHRFVANTPEWADPVVVLKFDHRKVITLDARWVLTALDEDKWHIPRSIKDGILDALSPRLTPSENISMNKPPLSSWESATSSEIDGLVVANDLGLPTVVSDD